MKITIEKNNSGTSVKCFIPKAEVETVYFGVIKDKTRDFRKQKTFKEPLNYIQRELLHKIIQELYKNLSLYTELYNSGENGSLITQTKLEQKLAPQVDEYEKKWFSPMLQHAFSFVFDEKNYPETTTIKSRYNLTDKDFITAVVGNLGTGKSLLIKKIFNFSDDFIFPLVDNGRATLCNCYFRGMLVYDNKIEGMDAGEYRFKNIIKLKNYEQFYNDVIAPNLSSSFDTYILSLKNNDDHKKYKTLKKFITCETANLDELFGDIDCYLKDNDKDGFYHKILNKFEKVLNKIPREFLESFEGDIMKIPGEYKKILNEDDELLGYFKICMNKKINSTLENIRKLTGNDTVEYNPAGHEVSFSLTRDEIGNIDDYYIFFTNNKSTYRGRLLRLMVEEIYTELDLDFLHMGIHEKKFKEYKSIVFADTPGAVHINNLNKNIPPISYNITGNILLLDECHTILVLDNACRSMGKTTLNQIKTLESFGYKHKMILVYSWYNYFLKKYFKNDEERQQNLLDILKERLHDTFEETPPKSLRIYKHFASNGLQRIVFLKGLVPYKNCRACEEKQLPGKMERKNTSFISEHMNKPGREEEFAIILNHGLEDSTACLKDLFCKMFKSKDAYTHLLTSTCLLETNVGTLESILGFSEYYCDFSSRYINMQKIEYLLHPTEPNMIQGLCRRLSKGFTGYHYLSRRLSPLDDAISIMMKSISIFMEDEFSAGVNKSNDDTSKEEESRKDFTKDLIRNGFLIRIRELFILILIKYNKDNFEALCKDSGPGTGCSEASEVYSIIRNTLGHNGSAARKMSFDAFRKSIEKLTK